MTVVSALRRYRKGDQKFKITLGWVVSSRVTCATWDLIAKRNTVTRKGEAIHMTHVCDLIRCLANWARAVCLRDWGYSSRTLFGSKFGRPYTSEGQRSKSFVFVMAPFRIYCYFKIMYSWVWWRTPLIQVLGRQRQGKL